MSTLEAYFLGKKDLFRGLAISELEDKWETFPVFHIDLNVGKYEEKGSFYKTLDNILSEHEQKYGIVPADRSALDIRFGNLVRGAREATGRNVVILIDEYDKPLLNCDDDDREDIENTLRSVYSVIKSYDKDIRFAMLTGVARFGKVSVFSALNNLNDISLDEDFNDICGVSQSELEKYFRQPIQTLAGRHRLSYAETLEKLKEMYDGYHFSNPEFTENVYNPFSLLNCFSKRRFGEFWFDTATPRYLIKALMKTGMNYSDLHNIAVDESVLVGVNVPEHSAASVLYQAGYLTIKDYDMRFGNYTLDFPNEEVKAGFTKVSFMVYGSKDPSRFDIAMFVRDLEQ